MLRRWLQHLTTTPIALRRSFPPATLAAIDAAITASERHHRAEIRCAVETALSAGHLVRGVTSGARATEVFSALGVWDTAENNGVLLYVLLAERKIEIVADRGFADRVPAVEWAAICAEMEVAFRAGRYEAGTLAALDRISALARKHFPSGGMIATSCRTRRSCCEFSPELALHPRRRMRWPMQSTIAIVLLTLGQLAAIPARAAAGSDLARATDALAALHPGQSGVLLLDTGAEALQQRDALIAAATRTIDAQYYIWNSDASGRYLAARLLSAADRGVHVRVLLDDINVAGRDAVFASLAAHPNVEIRIYNPSAAREGVLRLLGFIRDFSQLNRRMHNKSFTADGALGIVGGRNVGDEYFDLSRDRNFRDRELLAAGPVVGQITAGFEAFWNSSWTKAVEALARPEGSVEPGDLLVSTTADLTALGYVVPADLATRTRAVTLPALIWAPARLVFDPPPTAEQIEDSDEAQPVARELQGIVATARSEILVESAYFILGGQSLAGAARLHARGVRLRALTNSLASNDLVTNHSGYARRRPAMLDAGIELYELRPDAAACGRLIRLSTACDDGPAFALHSKSLVVDRRVVYIGSFNLNLRSTYLNSETALIVDSPALGARVAASIEELLQPDSSWQVVRGKDGGLEWVTQIDGREVRETHEPMTSAWRRFTSQIYRLFPLEKYL